MTRFLFALLLLLGISCTKINESEIPYAIVYLKLDLRYEDKDLVGSLHHKSFTAPRYDGERVGYSGVVVINGNTGYYAYDLCCPHEARQSVRVKPSDVGTAKCPECGSEYDLSYGNGNPTSGPSQYTLRRYNVMHSGQELIIRN